VPPSPEAPDSLRQRWRYFPRLLHFLWELGPRQVALIGALSLIEGLLPIAVLALLRLLVDSAVGVVMGQTPVATALSWLAAITAVRLLQVVLASAAHWFGETVRERLQARAHERLLATAVRLPLATFEQPDFYDQLHRAQRGLDERLVQTMEHVFPLPATLITAIGLLLYVGSASLVFPAILLAGLLPLTLINIRFYRRKWLLDRRATASERLLAYLDMLLTRREAAAEVRLFGLGNHLLERRQRVFREVQSERLDVARQELTASLSFGTGLPLSLALVMTGVVALVARGRLSLGYYAVYVGAIERFSSTFYVFLWSLTVLDNDLRYIRDLLDYLALSPEGAASALVPPPSVHPTSAPSVPAARPSTALPILPVIRFEAVSFAYPASPHVVLDGITLTIQPGETIALVGENGAGKSTLARLLLGLYTPTSGHITVDGDDLLDVDPVWWRSRVTAVFQEYVRYELTARENVGFGDLSRGDNQAAIEQAAARSGADGVIARLPGGYETLLGRTHATGQDLSTGQWQKLALARAYLRDAAVLVLDEPTAALDARAEVEVYRQFRAIAQGRSVLLISHRLGSARLADRILVLAGGRIVEEGSHADLLARGGRYAAMYTVQADWYR